MPTKMNKRDAIVREAAMKTETTREPIFETRLTGAPPNGLRITLTMEASSDAGMEWALAQGFAFARARMMGVTVSHKDNPTTRASCRTTKLRKRRGKD